MLKINVLLFLCGVSCCFGLRADCNGDGRVDLLDLTILASEWLMEVDMGLGPELVTNGGFDTDSDWSKTECVIADSVATLNGVLTMSGCFQLIANLENGKTYQVAFDIISGGDFGGYDLIFGNATEDIPGTGNGHRTYELVADFYPGDSYIGIQGPSTVPLVFDNVSVMEVLNDDRTPNSLANPAGNSLADDAGSLANPNGNSLAL